MDHATNRRDAGARGDEDRVAHRMLEREISMRSVKPDLVPFPQVGKPIGKKTPGNAVQAQVKRIVSAGRRRDRIGAGDLAAIMLGEHGNELSRLEVKLVCFL